MNKKWKADYKKRNPDKDREYYWKDPDHMRAEKKAWRMRDIDHAKRLAAKSRNKPDNKLRMKTYKKRYYELNRERLSKENCDQSRRRVIEMGERYIIQLLKCQMKTKDCALFNADLIAAKREQLQLSREIKGLMEEIEDGIAGS